ncbi:MAG TPA: DapH/DapD/GlmU-related protein [Steroidobacteraceae bacterium]|jgi:acetyltransferase-like isoleucine patch superfamily enzyme|nr:DapH/DapD/GlmU-related protein [Steroidobacteraceae bacterium]
MAGCPHLENDGQIQIGEDFYLSSHPVQSHLVVMRDAQLAIGNRVFISYGAAISARCSIQIGDDTRIGPFCLILDNDYHRVDDRDSPGGIAPIVIGRNVVLGARVTVLRGARIGDGARVMSGSTVAGVVAEGAVIAGVPARVMSNDVARAVGRSVASIVKRVFRLRALPSPLDGPTQIAEWTDNGSVRLLIALEDEFAVTLSEEHVRAARTVNDVARLVTLARDGKTRAARFLDGAG